VLDAIRTWSTAIPGHHADQIEAYLAFPEGDGPYAGVVVIHHMPGYDAGTKEIARRFATMGYSAIVPNLHYRDAPGAEPDDAAATNRANGGVPDEQLVGDITAAAEHLRSLHTANGKVGVIGYCSGGRQAFLAGLDAPVDAVVDCYGAFVTGTVPAEFPIPIAPLTNRVAELPVPLLGLFGAEDKHPSPADVAELEKLLTEHGKDFDLHSYDGAGHAFFSTDRVSYRAEAAVDGWARISAFFGKHLSA